MKESTTRRHLLPEKCERTLAAASAYFAHQNNATLQKLVVNSRYRVIEETVYDNWDGGIWGHDVILEVPSAIYFEVFNQLADVASELSETMNRIADCPGEFFSKVRLELADDPDAQNWREASGLLIQRTPLLSPSAADLQRIWEPGFVRTFVTHKSQHKDLASILRDRLKAFGVSCFVAHEAITPTREWQDEIEKALFSMHVLVALMTEGFHDSDWTDQEIGIAIGRAVPVIVVRLGCDPYGFVGKYQAVAGSDKPHHVLADAVFGALTEKAELRHVIAEGLVTSLESAVSYNHANTVIKLIDATITTASPDLVSRIETSPNRNSEVAGAFCRDKLPAIVQRLRSS